MVRMSSSPVRSPTWARRGYSWPPKLRWLIRPSGVRSNSAPYVSSSHTRSGASLACNSAIRQWFMNLPPRIVSRKCTCQLSLELTFPIAAAAPPSAITVWALPNSDLHTIAVRLPCRRASMAARSPAPPAPITTTSKLWRSISVIDCCSSSVNEAKVVEPTGGHSHHVEVRQSQGAERDPGQLHVARIDPGDERPGAISDRVRREMLQAAAGDVPA